MVWPLRLEAETELFIFTVDGRVGVLPSIVEVDLLGDSRLMDLLRDRVDELMLGWLPRGLSRLRLVMGFLSENNALL